MSAHSADLQSSTLTVRRLGVKVRLRWIAEAGVAFIGKLIGEELIASELVEKVIVSITINRISITGPALRGNLEAPALRLESFIDCITSLRHGVEGLAAMLAAVGGGSEENIELLFIEKAVESIFVFALCRLGDIRIFGSWLVLNALPHERGLGRDIAPSVTLQGSTAGRSGKLRRKHTTGTKWRKNS